MRERLLVRTSGPDPLGPAYTGIWSDPETTAEVMRIGYDHGGGGGTIIEVCLWRKPHLYARPINEILRRAFGADRPIRYRMRSWGREWYVWTPWKYQRAQLLTETQSSCAEWFRVSL